MSQTSKPTVAYFSAEYAIADDLPIYAGGLGILAADIVLEAGAGKTPFYAVGLVYHQAFTGDDPDQRPMTQRLEANGFELAAGKDGQRLTVSVMVADRTVKLQAWVKDFGPAKLILLDSHVRDNHAIDRAVSDHLYARDLKLQLAQEICLGFGGAAMLEALDLTPDVYHFNEGHTALAALAVTLRLGNAKDDGLGAAIKRVKPKLVGTKHTILAGAGILIDWGSVCEELNPGLATFGISMETLRPLALKSNGDYSATKLLLSLVHRVSGVSKIHVEAESHDHPDSHLIPITNGINAPRWIALGWDGDPLGYDDAKFWAVHQENRHQLLEFVAEQTGQRLDPERLTVVWARRMTPYKRPELLVSDMHRLARLAHDSKHPIQFVVAGKANPADTVGLELMEQVAAASKRSDLAASFAYLPHYNPASARMLVRGADLWLNTPIRGYEACGTSGMKASLNGALQFSTSDGWIDEVNPTPIGWILPVHDPEVALYDTLEDTIAPLFYQRDGQLPTSWITMMRANMKLIRDDFTTTRMLADYYRELYSA